MPSDLSQTTDAEPTTEMIEAGLAALRVWIGAEAAAGMWVDIVRDLYREMEAARAK